VTGNTNNGEELLCSHAGCRHSGIKFLWCGFCEAPAYKRGFSKRHTHTGEVMPREVRKLEQQKQEERLKIKKQQLLRKQQVQQNGGQINDAMMQLVAAVAAAPAPPSMGNAERVDDAGADHSGNESSNGETNEISGSNDEELQSSESSSDLDENRPQKKTAQDGSNQKDTHRLNDAEDDMQHSRKKQRSYYTVSFVDHCTNGPSLAANGAASGGADTAMSSLSSASEHCSSASDSKRKRAEYEYKEEEAEETSSSVSSMDEEGLPAPYASTGVSPPAMEAAAEQANAAPVAPSLKKKKEKEASMTSSTRAVIFPRLAGSDSPAPEALARASSSENQKEEDKKLPADSHSSKKRGAFWKAAKNAVSTAAGHTHELQSQSRSQSSSSDTPRAVSSAAGSGSRTGSGSGSGKTETDGTGSKCANSGSGQGSGSGDGTAGSDSTEFSRRESWAKMLRQRPPSSDTKAVTEWLIVLLEASDPAVSATAAIDGGDENPPAHSN
jgi:hypothetical protein